MNPCTSPRQTDRYYRRAEHRRARTYPQHSPKEAFPPGGQLKGGFPPSSKPPSTGAKHSHGVKQTSSAEHTVPPQTGPVVPVEPPVPCVLEGVVVLFEAAVVVLEAVDPRAPVLPLPSAGPPGDSTSVLHAVPSAAMVPITTAERSEVRMTVAGSKQWTMDVPPKNAKHEPHLPSPTPKLSRNDSTCAAAWPGSCSSQNPTPSPECYRRRPHTPSHKRYTAHGCNLRVRREHSGEERAGRTGLGPACEPA